MGDRTNSTRWRGAAWFTLLMASACASRSKATLECATREWSGMCTLRSVKKIEDRELPVPYVVYQAIYTPVANADTPSYTPPDVVVKMGALAQYEFALADHLAAQKNVRCHSQNTPGSCLPEAAVAEVAAFDPAQAPSSSAPEKKGCAAIEASSEQDRLAQSSAERTTIPERLLFDTGSAALSPDATELAARVAKRLNSAPSIECVGVVGQIAAGEPASLAESRAHAVKELLVSLGVDRGRLLTIALTSNVFGVGAKPSEAQAKDRRVSLSVLLQNAAPTKP